MAEIQKRHGYHISGSCIYAIVAGILMILLGILFFIFPLGSMLVAGIFVIIGLFLYGLYLIISFFTTPVGHRDGWQLAMGLITAVAAFVILLSNAANIIISFTLLLGVLSMMIGMNQIIGYSSLRGTSGAGFVLASGIVNILLALFLFFAPLAAAEVIAIVQGIYLCCAGVALIFEGFAKRRALPQL